MRLNKLCGLGAAGMLLILAGCSSAPSRVIADIPLVKSSASIPLKQQTINAVPQGELSYGKNVFLAGNQYQIGRTYQSASGLNCVRVISEHHHQTKRAMCQIEGQWQLLAPLISNSK